MEHSEMYYILTEGVDLCYEFETEEDLKDYDTTNRPGGCPHTLRDDPPTVDDFDGNVPF